MSGDLRPVSGILPFALETKNANRQLIIPLQNANEAALIKELAVFPARHFVTPKESMEKALKEAGIKEKRKRKKSRKQKQKKKT